ncbi:MAG: hypothetical protein J0M00_24310, partial [Burkholderiales bacterium]|nr:hypothetical protein [Burkholderiales bacterium]
MRSIEWSFYDAQTGVLAPVCSLLPEGADPLGFAPPGCVPFAGRLNPQTQRVDLQSGQVVPYRPPAPPADELRSWAWSDEAERWLPV